MFSSISHSLSTLNLFLSPYTKIASRFGCHGPRDLKRSLSPILNNSTYPVQTIRHGDTLIISWQRFNHPGDFVRLAMVPFEEFDDWTTFNAANAAKFSCYESNCGPDDPNDSYYGQPKAGFGEYYTCTDYVVQGGSDLAPRGSLGDQRVWQGGDTSNPGTDVCKYGAPAGSATVPLGINGLLTPEPTIW